MSKYPDSFLGQRSMNNTNPKKHPPLPNTPAIPSPLIRRDYVSIAVQTDPDGHDWYRPLSKPALAKRPFVSLNKRLLLRSQQDRKRLEESQSFSNTLDRQVDSGINKGSGPPDSVRHKIHTDTVLPDAGPGQSSTQFKAHELPERPNNRSSTSDSVEQSTVPPTLPSKIEQSNDPPVQGTDSRPTILHVQLPPKPVLFTDSSSTSPSVQTPSSAVPQSPYFTNPTGSYPPLLASASNPVHQSPAKKKVSLSDYMKRKGSQTVSDKQTAPESQSDALKPQSMGTNGEIKADAKEGSANPIPPRERVAP